MSPQASAASGRSWGLSTRLLVAYAIVVLGFLALVAVPLHLRLRKDYISRATQAFENVVSLHINQLRCAAEAGDQNRLDHLCELLNMPFQGRVTLLSPDGKVLADSMSSRCLERARPDCLPAIRARHRAMNSSYFPLDDTVTVRLHIRLGAIGPATVRLALPIRPVRLQIQRMNHLLLFTAGGALVGAALLAFWLARRIAHPVEEMTRVAERIAAGKFDGHDLPPPGKDEIGRLAEALNVMRRSLQTTLRELRAERNQARGVVENMSDGVIALDRDRIVTEANRAAADLLGVDDLPVGKPFSEIAGLPEELRRAVTPGESATLEFGDVRRGERVVSVAITPLLDPDGEEDEHGGVVLVLRDLTDARRAENLGRELVANASHELRTPLAIMAATADTMLTWADSLAPQQRECLDIIGRQAERMQQLVRETLELSKLEAGAPEEKMEPVDLTETTLQVVATLRQSAEEAQLELSANVPDDPITVPGIEAQLTGALTNLVENALHYTPPGGKIRVTLTVEDDHAVLAVSDTGPGIPPAEQRQIFERFVRGRAGDESRAEGSGLGLAIVRRIAEIHGGRVELDSTPGRGSTFRLVLPRRAGA